MCRRAVAPSSNATARISARRQSRSVLQSMWGIARGPDGAAAWWWSVPAGVGEEDGHGLASARLDGPLGVDQSLRIRPLARGLPFPGEQPPGLGHPVLQEAVHEVADGALDLGLVLLRE